MLFRSWRRATVVRFSSKQEMLHVVLYSLAASHNQSDRHSPASRLVPSKGCAEPVKCSDAVGRAEPVWQAQLWVEPVKPGLSSHSVLLLSENSALPLTSQSEAALGKPQGT